MPLPLPPIQNHRISPKTLSLHHQSSDVVPDRECFVTSRNQTRRILRINKVVSLPVSVVYTSGSPSTGVTNKSQNKVYHQTGIITLEFKKSVKYSNCKIIIALKKNLFIPRLRWTKLKLLGNDRTCWCMFRGFFIHFYWYRSATYFTAIFHDRLDLMKFLISINCVNRRQNKNLCKSVNQFRNLHMQCEFMKLRKGHSTFLDRLWLWWKNIDRM